MSGRGKEAVLVMSVFGAWCRYDMVQGFANQCGYEGMV